MWWLGNFELTDLWWISVSLPPSPDRRRLAWSLTPRKERYVVRPYA